MTARARPKGPDLKIIHGGGEDAWYRKLADLLDGDSWKLADTLLEEYPLDEYPDSGSVNTGLHAALLRDEEMLRKKFGVVISQGHLRGSRATAIAWPPEEREPSTSYTVHFRMRGEGRKAEMQKRLRQAKREGWPLNQRMLARYRADEKGPASAKPYQERMKRAVAAAVKREMLGGITTKRPDWWMAVGVGDGDRDVAVQVLRALASEIAKGTK